MRSIGVGQFRLEFVDLACGPVKRNRLFFKHSRYAKKILHSILDQ